MIIPTIGDNKYIIDLNFKPSIVEFEGFVNYGSPIQSTGVGSDGKPMSLPALVPTASRCP